MFKNALAHVQHCYKALFVYVGITAGYVALKVAIETLLLGHIDTTTPNTTYLIINLLLSVLIYSIAQAIAFPMLAREIEKPLWKVETNRTTFLRFFSFWFTINLAVNMFQLLFILAELSPDTKFSLIIFSLCLATTVIPFGATVMFYGNTTREEISQALNTMIAQLPYYLITFLCTFWLYWNFIGLKLSGLPDVASPILEIVSGYAECVIFAFCWELCKKHREERENSDDYDF